MTALKGVDTPWMYENFRIPDFEENLEYGNSIFIATRARAKQIFGTSKPQILSLC